MARISLFAGWLLLCPSGLWTQEFVLKTEFAGLGVATHNNGVAVADYDQDGDLDIYLVGQKKFVLSDETTWNRFFRNNGDGTFAELTREAGLLSRVTTTLSGETGQKQMGKHFGASWGDANNDEYPDLFITNVGPNQLYLNRGDGTFDDISESAGVVGDMTEFSSSALWWDYDLDGDLDLYTSAWFGVNRLYRNNGDLTFLEIGEAAGLADLGNTWTSVPLDVDNDGLLDLYVVNDFGANRLYVNNGDLTFSEITAQATLEDEKHGMGVTVGDYDNNGFLDIYLTNITGLAGDIQVLTNPLFTNSGQGTFINHAAELGVAVAGWGWGVEFFDYDHDGDLDLYVVNGFFSTLQHDQNVLFRNLLERGAPGFDDVSYDSGANSSLEARGLAVFDYDDDGDLDLLVANFQNSPHLYANETRTQNWLKVVLRGVQSNINGFGATVTVSAAGRTFIRQNDGVGFLAQSIQPVHFGVGSAARTEQVSVRWPTGNVERFPNVTVNRTIICREGEGTPVVSRVNHSRVGQENAFELLGSSPNPFNSETRLTFFLPRRAQVELRIFDLVGGLVYSARESYATGGQKTMLWSATGPDGGPLPTAVYVFTLRADGVLRSGKLLFLK